jgi:hypothetical protein
MPQQNTAPQNTPMQPTLARPLADPAEAQALISHLSDVMDALLDVVEEETKLVRLGKLTEVARLEPRKTNLARLYLVDTGRLTASQTYLAKALPGVLRVLRERHNTFRAMLQINLTVLATAHAVAEGIIRGVSAELNRSAAPQTYGATGRRNVPPPRNALPLSVSRSL